MKFIFAASVLVLSSGLVAAGGAFAQSQGESLGSQVEQARRSGDLLAPGEAGLRYNELSPGSYPVKPKPQGLTRQQVENELAAAQRSGDLITGGEASLTLGERFPGGYPQSAHTETAGLSRAQVEAELREAMRTGDLIVGGEVGGKCSDVHPTMHAAK